MTTTVSVMRESLGRVACAGALLRTLMMSDLMVDELNPVDIADSGEWERAMYELAFTFWCSHGHNGARVEFLLTQHAQAQTMEGEAIPPVPSARTITGWAKDDQWEQRQWQNLSQDLPARVLRLQIAKLTLAEQAVETLHDVNAGVYDALDPRIASTKSKTAVEVLKMVGLGTFGANQGGLSVPGAQELMIALGEQADEKKLSAKEQSRANREHIAAGKRGE